MKYLGGKAKAGLGKRIAERLLTIVPPEHRCEYLEPFLGGANVFEHIAPHFEKTYAGDVHEDLILMWQAVAAGWVPPEHVSEEEYLALKKAAPSALRGFAGFSCSFGGKWFGGYARGVTPSGRVRSYASEGVRNVAKAAPTIAKATTIGRASYLDWPVVPGVVLYCDPPYAGTLGYKGTSGFDHDTFWRRMNEWSEVGSYVFVSEEAAPLTCCCVWERTRKMQLGANNLADGGEQRQRLEKLFYLPPRRIALAA